MVKLLREAQLDPSEREHSLSQGRGAGGSMSASLWDIWFHQPPEHPDTWVQWLHWGTGGRALVQESRGLSLVSILLRVAV